VNILLNIISRDTQVTTVLGYCLLNRMLDDNASCSLLYEAWD